MCGLCGWVSFDGTNIDQGLVRAATDALRHRGPDQEGFWFRDRAAVGFRRLTVIGLSPAANQPFVSRDGDVALVCNGEIFNYRALRSELASKGHEFETDSDCEVCIHAYQEHGSTFLEHLSGMFALAVVDLRKNTLLLARDRLGVKPLYYRMTQAKVSFASELKALLCDQGETPTIDPLALNLYTVQDAVPAPFTVYQDVRKLRPAEVLEIDLSLGASSARTRTYWQLPQDELKRPIDQDQLAEQLRATLGLVVEEQSMSDVPLGVFLSGGMDSSSVLALLRDRYEGNVVTLTAQFAGSDSDESEQARALAQGFGTEHHTLHLDSSSTRSAEHVLPLFDEPFGDSSAIPTHAIAEEARQHVKVVLTGEGGDELFGGYLRQSDAAGFRWAHRLPESLRRIAAAAIPSVGPLTRAARFALPNWALTASLHHPITDPVRRSLLRHDWRRSTEELIATYAPLRVRLEQRTPLQGYFDGLINRYLPDDLLTKVDRMTSAHGIEARVPLLDHRVVELAARIPASLKISGATTKPLLRQAMSSTLPASVLRHPKRGFGLPPSFSNVEDLRQRTRVLADESDLVREIINLDQASSWDPQTCWRGLALAIWIARCYQPLLGRGTRPSP